jgi:hypothetical protein
LREGFIRSDATDEARDAGASIDEKARAAVEKANMLAFQNALTAADRKHGPTASLLIRAINGIADAGERERVLADIRALRDRYAGTAEEYRAPNGKRSLLLDALGEDRGKQAWYAVRSRAFREYFGDWERAARIAEIERMEAKPTRQGNSESARRRICSARWRRSRSILLPTCSSPKTNAINPEKSLTLSKSRET